jgi:23S rRNA (cytidine2498-2'-O)-methyltransferase
MQKEFGCRAAFARPGLITFKFDQALEPQFPRPHPLIRTWGVSLGFVKNIEDLGKVIENLVNVIEKTNLPFLQVCPGEAGPKGHVPPLVLESWKSTAQQMEQAILNSYGHLVQMGEPQFGEAVLDVIVRPQEPWIVGWHRHGGGRGPLPGAQWNIPFPADAPSRSWAKLEELMRWSDTFPKSGESALEIGCSPGGATMALLDRGLKVCSVDPRPVVLPERYADAPFIQHQSLIEHLARELFPQHVDWMVVDMGVAAPIAVHALTKIVPKYKNHIKGMFITLKLNEWALAERIPSLLEQIHSMGFAQVEAACLPTFRQEIGVVAKK